MKRETGWYWVKLWADDPWRPAYYREGKGWREFGTWGWDYNDPDIVGPVSKSRKRYVVNNEPKLSAVRWWATWWINEAGLIATALVFLAVLAVLLDILLKF